MLITCWSVKGGSGTTVVAASLALIAASHGVDTCVVDLAGDIPAALGISEPCGPGIGHWLCAAPNVPVASLKHLEIPVTEHLNLLPLGQSLGQPVVPSIADVGGTPAERVPEAMAGYWSEFVDYLVTSERTYIVDGGSRGLDPAIRRQASHDVLVLRGCYLAIRRVAALTQRPSEVVLISEPGRALRRPEVETSAGAPIVAEIPWDPVVARAIDSGLLASRLPRSVRDGLAALGWW